MKRIEFALFVFAVLFAFASCDVFTTPLFSSSKDISNVVANMTTEDISINIDMHFSDPKQISILLEELAQREDIDDLPLEGKENILSATVVAVLPMSEVTSSIQTALEDKENSDIDFDALLDSVVSSGTQVDMTVAKKLLEDEEVLENADAYTIMLSATAIVVSVVNNETEDGGSTKEKLDLLKECASASSAGNANYDKDSFESSLSAKGFASESIESLVIVMDVLSVLNGTAADKPNRKEDVSDISIFGFSMDDFLSGFLGVDSPQEPDSDDNGGQQ